MVEQDKILNYNTTINHKFISYNYKNGLFLDEKNKRFADMNTMDSITRLNYIDRFTNVSFLHF